MRWETVNRGSCLLCDRTNSLIVFSRAGRAVKTKLYLLSFYRFFFLSSIRDDDEHCLRKDTVCSRRACSVSLPVITVPDTVNNMLLDGS